MEVRNPRKKVPPFNVEAPSAVSRQPRAIGQGCSLQEQEVGQAAHSSRLVAGGHPELREPWGRVVRERECLESSTALRRRLFLQHLKEFSRSDDRDACMFVQGQQVGVT